MLFKTVVFSCLFFLASQPVFSQYDAAFIRHLSRENLQREHRAYLGEFENGSDSAAYYRAKYALQYADDSLFFDSFKSCKKLFFSDTLVMNFACQHFVGLQTETRTYWFDSLLGPEKERYVSPVERLYAYSLIPASVSQDSIPLRLRESFEKYRKLSAKKPGLAALQSALVPGLGKAYIGDYRSFVTSLTSLGLFFLQGRESYVKKGPMHLMTLLNAGFFGTFYVVNIHGSYRECRLKTEEFKNQYLLDVSDYFYSYSTRLYR